MVDFNVNYGGMKVNVFKSLLMGIVQGLTEFLPVSSSGHLAIFEQLLNMNLDNGLYFDIMLHLGTLIAVIIVFREDIWGMIRETWGMLVTVFANLLVFIAKKKGNTKYTYFKVVNSSYRKLVLMVIISTIPTGILGMVGAELVSAVSDTLWIVGIYLIITGVLLLLADSRQGMLKIKDATYSSAFLLGIVQGVATMPGLSRSGTTIAAARMMGYNKKLAVKYSFIMSIPAVLGAIVVKFNNIGDEAFGSSNLPGYIAGTIAAGITGYFAIKFMLKLIKNRKYIGFSIYCFVAGMAAIGISVFK